MDSCDYEYSYHSDVIVSQLTTILDYLDAHIDSFNNKDTYTLLVAELSLCLKDKHNINLLPYLYILRRYQNSHECLDKLLEIFHISNKPIRFK